MSLTFELTDWKSCFKKSRDLSSLCNFSSCHTYLNLKVADSSCIKVANFKKKVEQSAQQQEAFFALGSSEWSIHRKPAFFLGFYPESDEYKIARHTLAARRMVDEEFYHDPEENNVKWVMQERTLEYEDDTTVFQTNGIAMRHKNENDGCMDQICLKWKNIF